MHDVQSLVLKNHPGLDRLYALVQEEVNRLELEDDLESMPYSSQHSDTSTVATPPRDKGTTSLFASPNDKSGTDSSHEASVYPFLQARQQSTQPPIIRQLHDHTFTLNAEF
jgi:hypothetical protein